MIYIILYMLLGAMVLYLFLVMPRFAMREHMKRYKGQAWAHRGLHCVEKGIPENSMLAFKAAVKQGYGIELDVHLTKDMQLVVFHDDNLERVCNRLGVIEEMTYKELTSCYLSGTAERIPLFSTVLNYVNGRVPLLIEVKLPGANPTICEYLAQELDKYAGAYLVQSFNCIVLGWLKKNRKGYLRGQLSSNLVKSTRTPHGLFRLCAQYLLCNCIGRPDFISYKMSDASNVSVRLLHTMCKTPTAVWTIRSEKAMKTAKKKYDMYIFERI